MTYRTHLDRKIWLMLSLTLGLVCCLFASWRVGAREPRPLLSEHNPPQRAQASGALLGRWSKRHAPGSVAAAVALFNTITVNTTADDNTVNGNCTLREAIIAANTNAAIDACAAGAAGLDRIQFNIGVGTPSIAVSGSALPEITEPVIIDGATGGATRVELNGAGAGALANGLDITAGSSTIKALVINRFFNGIRLAGAGGNTIVNCFLGTNAAGTANLGNTLDGVLISGPNNTVGGTTAGERNLISGNNRFGVFIVNAIATGNKVTGNYIGTDVTGTVDLGNTLDGLQIQGAPNNTVGGTTAGERNLISGNDANGVGIFNAVGIFTPGATGNKIIGNYIGTDVTGTIDLGNTGNGVLIIEPNNTVGGTTMGERNLISGNNLNGVLINGGRGTGIKVIGNYIGTDVTGTADLGNTLDGVLIAGPNNTVGGTIVGERNLISGNDQNGVCLEGAIATGNKLLGNSIFNNTLLGINLAPPLGVTANDPGDADTGANNRQNFPVITALTTTTISGTLDSLPANTSYPVRLEFFANTACDSSGNGEGEIFLGATDIAAPGTFAFGYTPVAGKPFITATATDNAGNTSEFSACATPQPIVVNLADPFSCTGSGNALTVTVRLTNTANGAQPATFTVTTLPAGLVGLPGTGTSTVGAPPTVTAMSVMFNATLASGQTATVTYQVQVSETVTSGTQMCITTTSTFGGVTSTPVQTCTTVNCPAAGPGALAAATSPLNDQRPGSVLIYNVFTSSVAAPNQQNTRLSLTNTHPLLKSYVHLFFIDGASCSVADGFVCLTPNQTTSFLASDLDPGTSGYVVAVAVDALGCPISFNHLIGDEFVKFSSGHAANLGAEAATAIAGGLPLCDGNTTTVELRFDGNSYSVLPHVLAADNLGSRADGNDTLLILNRIGGSLATGAATLANVFGILYDDAEAPVSFSFVAAACQLRSVLSGNSIRTVPRYEQFIPAGRTGWLKASVTNLGALTGAVLNFNANAAARNGAFNQGHNLHKLTTTNAGAVTIPVFPPGC